MVYGKGLRLPDGMQRSERMMFYTIFIALITALAILLVSMKACAERLLPDTPQHVNESGEPVYEKVETRSRAKIELKVVAASLNSEGNFPMDSSLSFYIDGVEYVVQVGDEISENKKFEVKRHIIVWRIEREDK